MRQSKFEYVDVAINGAKNRNHVCSLDELSIPHDATDCYTSMFLFKKEYKQHVEDSGSVRGADQFSVWSPYLWFDIDAADLQDATIDMQALLRGIRSVGVLEHAVLFFSGSKGYHVGIEASLFGFVPSQTLPDEMRRTALAIASLFNVEIDTKIYNHNRLWRVVDTLHSKTKLRKTMLSCEDALQMTVDEIREAAAAERAPQPRYLLCDDAEPVDTLVRLRENACKGKGVERTNGWDAPPMSEQHQSGVQAGLDYLLTIGVGRGNRDNEALLRAAECRKIGYNEEDCLSKLADWNLKNEPPLPDRDLERIVRSAYTGDGYDFGTNNESLRVAREQGTHTENGTHPLRAVIDAMPVAIQQRFFPDILSLAPSKAKEGSKGGHIDRLQREMEALNAETWAEMCEDDSDEEINPWLVPLFKMGLRQCVTVLGGKDKAGKGTIVATTLKQRPQNQRVLIFNADEPRNDFKHRMRKAGIKPCDEWKHVLNPTSWQSIALLIQEFKPDLIFFDALITILNSINDRPVDHSADLHWSRIMSDFNLLAAQYEAGVIVIHHTNRNAEIRGSGQITAGATINITVKTDKRSDKTTLTYDGRRDVPALTFKFEPPYSYVRINDNEIKEWPESTKRLNRSLETYSAILPLLLPGKPVPRSEINRAGYDRQKLNRFRKRFAIEVTGVDENEQWRATSEQISDWRDGGVERLLEKSGSVRDVINNNKE